MSGLEEILRSGRGLLWSSRLHPSPTGSNCLSIKTDNNRDIPVAQSNSSLPKNDGNESFPRLPDIYLTPSRPVYSSESPPSSSNHSPASESNSSIPHSSPLSSLPNLDPFTPDTISAPPTRDHSGVYSGVPGPYSGVATSLTPLGQLTNKNAASPETLVGGDCGRGSSSTSVLQWLMNSSHQVEVEEGCEGGGWRGGEGEREREKFSPADSEVVETATAAVASSVSTLSPPVSCECNYRFLQKNCFKHFFSCSSSMCRQWNIVIQPQQPSPHLSASIHWSPLHPTLSPYSLCYYVSSLSLSHSFSHFSTPPGLTLRP